MFLMKSFMFLLVELLLISVSFNPCLWNVFGYKLLGYMLFRYPKFLGWDPWEFGKVKR